MASYKLLFLISPLFLICCQNEQGVSVTQPEVLYQQYCGTCHLPVDPANLTKDIWANSILPRMGWRLGVRTPEAEPYKGLDAVEIERLKQHAIYPEVQVIEEAEWKKIEAYVISKAPETMELDQTRIDRNQISSQFVRKDLHVDQLFGSSITAIEFDEKKKELWMGDYAGKIFHWSKSGNLSYEVKSPVVDFHFSPSGTLFTQIGELYPTELEKGVISLFDGEKKTDLVQNIHRPVHSELMDLNNDGKEELIVAKYGNKIGGLSLFVKKGTELIEQVLIDQPGAIKFYIKDLNGDQKLDIIALFAQGDEAIYTLIQKDNFEFQIKKVLHFPAEYGTSDFALFDYDQDGDLDIATVHGDNADYSYVLKPYHGLRLHINTAGTYAEAFFYPMYGATKLQVDDFDQDGDWDFALSAFFPDFDQLLAESFVYLENKAYQEFRFQPQIVKSEMPIRSLTLEKADFDGDGDMDLIMGLFMISPQPIPVELEKQWKTSKMDIAVFSNTLF